MVLVSGIGFGSIDIKSCTKSNYKEKKKSK
jgi:hypothetical protein